ncbi:MAG: family 20 glycosylhydrolase [Rhodanobacteraceae bacterium]
MKVVGNNRCRCALLLTSLLGVSAGNAQALAARAPLPIIPVPAQAVWEAGYFRVADRTVISVRPGNRKADWAAHYLAQLVARTRGLNLSVRIQDSAPRNAIRLALDPHAPETHAQGYVLDVGPRGIRVLARSQAGLFYGAVSVWQLLTPDNGHGPVKVPGLSIHDWPRFAWRGLMLDSARHMQSVPDIEHILNQMALHKLDVFHWHLTDDQGWRLQIKGYPKLTSLGAWRTPPGAGTHGEPLRYGGFYTQAQVHQIVAYAAARHITVVPELDMPGHAQAAVASYPDVLGVTHQPPKVTVKWGVNPYLYSVSTQSLDMIRNVMGEVLQLFPSTYIHVGGDEAIKDQWKASPAVQAKMKALGLKNEDALQSWFIGRVGNYLSEHGRRLIGWDEILQGGLPANAAVESWQGTAGAVKASKMGHDVVLAPQGSLYFDHLQSRRQDEPGGQFPLVPLAKVYAFDPAPPSLDAEQRAHVLGTEAALWTEYMNSPWEVQHAIYPRLDALSEVAWSPQSRRHFDDFLERLPPQLQRYRTLGIDVAGSAFAVHIHLANGRGAALATRSAEVVLDNQTHFGRIHYTINGGRPTPRSATYTEPFNVNLPATVRATAFSAAGVPLADQSARLLNEAALLTRVSSQLQPCAHEEWSVRAPLLPDLGSRQTPVYNVDDFASCWIYPDARLNSVEGIRVDVARLSRNQALAHAQVDVATYPRHTPSGELEVRLNSCSGALVADIALPAGRALGERFELESAMQALQGNHDLCLRFTAPVRGPLYAIGAVHLLTRPIRGKTGVH